VGAMARPLPALAMVLWMIAACIAPTGGLRYTHVSTGHARFLSARPAPGHGFCRPRARATGAVTLACQIEPVEILHPDTGAAKIWVVPAGYSGPKQAPEGAVDLVVSTKEGWGDGYHPTTALCLEFLSKYVDPTTPQKVLDYGTGSGVLGIAACKLGCKSVTGIDIDDEALEEVC
jgi:hypothetical protein